MSAPAEDRAPLRPIHRSVSCDGETCTLCGAPADVKVGEEIMHDDPFPDRHNWTAYICLRCANRLFFPYLHATAAPLSAALPNDEGPVTKRQIFDLGVYYDEHERGGIGRGEIDEECAELIANWVNERFSRLTAALDRVRDDARWSRRLAARLLCELGYAPDPRAATQLASIGVITSRNTHPFKGKARPLTDDECDAILAAARARPEGSND